MIRILNEKACLPFLSIILVVILLMGYGSYTQYTGDKPFLNWIGLIGFTLIFFGVSIFAWSGSELWKILPSSKKADKEIEGKIQKNEILTEDEQRLHTNNEMLRTSIKCSLIILSSGFIVLFVYEVIMYLNK